MGQKLDQDVRNCLQASMARYFEKYPKRHTVMLGCIATINTKKYNKIIDEMEILGKSVI